jgi:hypothetical protein
MTDEPKAKTFRETSLSIISHALAAADENAVYDLNFGKKLWGASVELKLATTEDYAAIAERLLDREIIKMAEERILARISKA